jgi:hypothetical protein
MSAPLIDLDHLLELRLVIARFGSIDEPVRERTSPAVKPALKSRLEAPSAVGAARKTKKGKADA